MLKLNNPALAVLRESMLAPGLLERAADIAQQYAEIENKGWEEYRHNYSLYDWLMERATFYAPGVFSFPLISESYCEALDEQFDFWCSQGEAKPNEEEHKPYQIPEITLRDQCPSLYLPLETIHSFWIKSISKILMGFDCDYIQSIQLARYEPSEVSGGSYHTDHDSDLTTTIPIRGSHLYTGGGVRISQDTRTGFVIKPIPVGHGLFFRGKTTLHKGLPVTSGKRDLLVYWTTVKYRG